ncbi:response regulator transcription factor [Pseudactinotalea suaedae]|uniref:response regulator transcription factor n=1 Tax=Pseudactinotalea suaedae TaxID=1524924 RepID=UPI0012E0D309|nr:response regulator transcription factor [Pseudactinotalea suaedae]
MAVGHDVVEVGAAKAPEQRATVLLYSDDRATRAEIRTLVGRRASIDTPLIDWVEVASPQAVIDTVKRVKFDLLVLDGETPKVGGIGMCRTLKTSVYECPPVLLLIARQQDAWLASWSEADAVVAAPLDPVELQETVATQLRGEA